MCYTLPHYTPLYLRIAPLYLRIAPLYLRIERIMSSYRRAVIWWYNLLTALSYRTYVLSVTTHCWRDGLWTMAPSAGWRSTIRCTKYVTTRTHTCVQSAISYCFCSLFIFVHHRSISCIQTFNMYAVHCAFVWIQLSPSCTTIKGVAKSRILKTRVSNSAFSNSFLRKKCYFSSCFGGSHFYSRF